MFRNRCVVDEDLQLFKQNVSSMRDKYMNSSKEQKEKILNALEKIMEECKTYIGTDLRFDYRSDVKQRFVSFYLPRLKVLQKTMNECKLINGIYS